MIDRLAIPVVFVSEPDITVDADGGVDVLYLDGPQALRADQQVIDFAAGVAVSVEESPVVAQLLAEFPGDALLPSDAGLEDLLGVGGDALQHRTTAFVLADLEGEPEPGEPSTSLAGGVAGLAELPELTVVLGSRVRVRVFTPPPGSGQQVTRM